jgi:radical SAM protein with 4Fe4S-binding SPASM domain
MSEKRLINRDNYIWRKSNMDVHAHIGNILGTKYTEYRQAWDHSGPDSIPSFPVHLDLELADQCNKQCLFCPRNLNNHENFRGIVGTHEKLSWETIAGIAEEAGQYGLRSLNLGAGCEPLINDHALDVVELFHAKGIVDSWIITNGVLLDRWIKPILDSCIVNLFVSIDAYTEETYRKLRGEGFQDVCQGVLNFLETREKKNKKLPLVRVSFIDHPLNHHEIDDFLSFWTDKVDMVDIQKFFNYSVNDFTLRTPPKRQCLDPFRRLAVRGNGQVIPCASDFGLDIVVGDIKTQSLKAIWDGASLAKVRSDLLSGQNYKCKYCQTV